MSIQIVVFRRRFIVVRRISMPACSEKGTFHCLVHKVESKKRDSDERNYFPQARRAAEEAYEIEKKREKERLRMGEREREWEKVVKSRLGKKRRRMWR